MSKAVHLFAATISATIGCALIAGASNLSAQDGTEVDEPARDRAVQAPVDLIAAKRADARARRTARRARDRRIYSSRPQRFQWGELREENLNDIEVRQIVEATRNLKPGAVVTFDGVREGCPCEEGVQCTAQVWVVAYESHQNNGLQLSRVEGKWQVGKLQKWWWEYEALQDRRKRVARLGITEQAGSELAKVNQALASMWEAFPSCDVEEDLDQAG